jgi:ketosteroid isomerase-like protein
MSQENGERLRVAYELLNTQFAAFKTGELDALLDFFDPEVVIEMVDVPDPATYEGHDGVRRWFNDFFGVWAAIRVEAEEFIESGQWTVAQLRTSLRGEASGVEVEVSTTAVHQFRDGRIVRDRVYLNRVEALKAAGLSEQDAHADS